jgi:hypothetical protein
MFLQRDSRRFRVWFCTACIGSRRLVGVWLPARRPASAWRSCCGTAERLECDSARSAFHPASAGGHAAGQRRLVGVCLHECRKTVQRDSRRLVGVWLLARRPASAWRSCCGTAEGSEGAARSAFDPASAGGHAAGQRRLVGVPACQAASKAKDLKPFSFTEKPNKIPPCLIQGAELLSQQATYTTKKLFSI